MLTNESVIKAFQANNFKDTVLTCPDGAEVVVSPCGYGEITSVAQCEYFLVYGDLPWMGAETLEALVKQLNRHAQDVQEAQREKDKLARYFRNHEASGWDDDSWEWYSDWHKDLYGYRPHGRVCGEYISPW